MLPWPAQSPDLNPIEQLWELVKTKLEKTAGGRLNSKNIWEELQKSWNSITTDECKKYVSTMPDRCIAVKLAKGGHTDY